MISITTQTASEYFVVLEEKDGSQLDRYSRRISRTATLDGGSVVNDLGFSDTDRTVVVDAWATGEQVAALKHMIRNYALWNVAMNDGFYVCAPKHLYPKNGDVRLILLIAE